MKPTPPYSIPKLKRLLWFGVIVCLVGLCFSLHGGWHLLEIYSRKMTLFELESVFTPEKGRMWSQFLAGLSVCVMGILMVIKAGLELKAGR